jgi:hypothetical protein
MAIPGTIDLQRIGGLHRRQVRLQAFDGSTLATNPELDGRIVR